MLSRLTLLKHVCAWQGKALPDVAQPVVAGGAAADSAAVKADAHINGDAAATPATDEASKPATKGDLKDDKLDKPKEKKRKYKVDEDLLQAFRYFDRNCESCLLEVNHSGAESISAGSAGCLHVLHIAT